MTPHEQLLKQGYRPICVGGTVLLGKRVDGERSLRVHLTGDKAFVQVMQRVNGEVTELSASTVSISPTEAITCFFEESVL